MMTVKEKSKYSYKKFYCTAASATVCYSSRSALRHESWQSLCLNSVNVANPLVFIINNFFQHIFGL
jgi:hypothetical protein